MNDSDYPALYRAADTLAMAKQRCHYTVLRWQLTCLVLAALATAATELDAALQLGQALLLCAALGMSIYLFVERPYSVWYESRAIAESIKTLSWRFMMHAAPFASTTDSARAKFREKLRLVLDQHRGVARSFTTDLTGDQITEGMIVVRESALEDRLATYKTSRIEKQRLWYARRAGDHRRRAVFYFGSGLGVNGLAVAFAFLRVKVPGAQIWPTDVLIVISASLLAWWQVNRFSELATSYTLAAHEIGLIREQVPDVRDDASFARFVVDAETAFSREHTQWLARRSE